MVRAQDTVGRATDLLAAPGARALARLRRGAPIAPSATNGSYVQVAVEGWVAAPFLGAARDSFTVTVNPGPPVRLLADAAPRAAVVADLRAGMGLQEVERRGAWVHVRRTGWISSSSIAKADSARSDAATATVADSSASRPAAPAPSNAPIDTSRDGIELTPVGQTGLASSPEGTRVGTLLPGARATITGRDRGWVRVQVEGWAREADFSVADTALRGALSAADLRADPDGTVGRVVHWDVEVLAHQVADPLRKGLVNHEPYLLAQGPSGENALLYLAIPPALVATVAQTPDLSRATITARVRSGRSEPVGVPVLELITFVRR